MTDETATMIKVKRKVVGSSFKFFDYHIYDGDAFASLSSSSGSGSVSNTDSSASSQKKEKSATDSSSFIVQMFGINEKGDTCCVYVYNFKPFFFVKVAENWTQGTVNLFLEFLRSKLTNYYKTSILSAELIEQKKLYEFSADKKYKFIKLTFKNKTIMNRVKNFWYQYSENSKTDNAFTEKKLKPMFFTVPGERQRTRLDIYEANISPLLRFFHINNLSPSGWIFIPTGRPCLDKKTTCKYEFFCYAEQLKPLPNKETIVPYKICSFDIEASSSHGDFPLPKKTYKKLAMNIADLKVETDADLTKIILSAFQMKTRASKSVDLVFPKEIPTKETIMNCIDSFLKTAIHTEKIKDIPTNNLDSFFAEDDDAAAGGGGDDAKSDTDEVTSHYYAAECGSCSHSTFDILLPRDLLKSTKYTKEEKVKLIDSSLTALFPPLEGDKTTFIGSTFMKYGDSVPYKNHCIALGSCDRVANAEIVSVETERELLMAWRDLIQTENPDIIIGYNIFGFDYEFLFRRAEENNCHTDFLQLSRNIDHVSGAEDNTGEFCINKTNIHLASGEYNLHYFDMIGRLQIDMLIYMRREFNNLSSYKLDNVAGSFISDSIKKIELDHETGRTILYSSNLTGLSAGDFIHIEMVGFTTDYYKNGKKYCVYEISKDTIVINDLDEEITEVLKKIQLKWCMSKDDVSPQDIFRLSGGSSSDRAIVAKYCIQDCNLVHHLMKKIDVVTGYIEMSNICSVPISFLVFRGQGIKLTSFVAKKCREKGIVMPDLDKTGENEGYEGAIVLPPKCAMYMDNPVACVDYSSLYPSSMISQNYSPDSKVWKKEYDLEGNIIYETGIKDQDGNYIYDNLPDYKYIDVQFDTFKYLKNPKKAKTAKAEKTKTGYIICRWAQFPDNKKGIMPSILQELLKARSQTKKLMKNEKDPFMQNILDKRQLGYKVTANSLYGQCGAKTSTFYEKDVAASTTATGRTMILYAKKIIEDVYGDLQYDTKCKGMVRTRAEYVYGDTDSVFFTFNLENPKTGEKIRGKDALEITIEIAQDAAKLCTKWLKSPMELSYEKTLMPFILLSKKRYVGILYETDIEKGYLKYMGLSLKRRDSCDYLKDTYGGVLNILIREQNISKAIDFLNESLQKLIVGKVATDKLAITKSLRSFYKNPSQIAHNVLAERIGERDPGNKPKSGDRIKFIHFVVPEKGIKMAKMLQGDKIETPEFIFENKLKIDYTFYITNQLMKPLQQLFGLALEDIYEILEKRSGLAEYRCELKKLEKSVGDDLEIFMKQKEKISSARIKSVLFDPFLFKIQNEKNNNREITDFINKTKTLLNR